MSAVCTSEREALASLADAWGDCPYVTGWVSDVGLERAVSKAQDRMPLRPGREVLDEAERLGVRLVLAGDDEWPARLAGCPEGPLGLWVRGNATLLPQAMVAVTGSTASTAYGAQMAQDLTEAVVTRGVNVLTAGLAGIAGKVVNMALALALGGPDPRRGRPGLEPSHVGWGRPVVALPHGLAAASSRERTSLALEVKHCGLLLSTFSPETRFSRRVMMRTQYLLPRLAEALVLVEGGAESACLLGEEARAVGCPMGAVPGPVTSALSAGCHALLRDGRARLVTEGRDVVALMRREATV